MNTNFFTERFNTKSGFFDLRFHEVKKIVQKNKDLTENPEVLKKISDLYKCLVKSYFYIKAFESDNWQEELNKIDFSSQESEYMIKLNEYNSLNAVRSVKGSAVKLDREQTPQDKHVKPKKFDKKFVPKPSPKIKKEIEQPIKKKKIVIKKKPVKVDEESK